VHDILPFSFSLSVLLLADIAHCLLVVLSCFCFSYSVRFLSHKSLQIWPILIVLLGYLMLWRVSICLILHQIIIFFQFSRDQYLSVCPYIRHSFVSYVPTLPRVKRKETNLKGMLMFMKYFVEPNSILFPI